MVTRYDAPGTLPRPGPVGRGARLLGGLMLLCFFVVTLSEYRFGVSPRPTNMLAWIALAFVLYALPGVVNLGYGRSWGRWPRAGGAAVLVGGGLLDRFLVGAFFGPVFGLVFYAMLVYVLGHIALSLFLSALLATPG